MLIEFKELFEKFNYKPKGIVHCGSSTGQERDKYAEFEIPVIWIEAIPEVYQELVQNLKPYPNQYPVLACLGEVDDKEVVFNVSNNEAQSSSYLQLGFHKTAHPSVEYIRTFTTKTQTLETVLSILNNSVIKVDKDWLLVGDLQGAEMLMLEGAKNILHKFSGCYLEVNTKEVYEGCALKNEIEDYLTKYDFKPVEEFIYEQWGWGDQFFIKSNLLKV